jgi:hypothetical protein
MTCVNLIDAAAAYHGVQLGVLGYACTVAQNRLVKQRSSSPAILH